MFALLSLISAFSLARASDLERYAAEVPIQAVSFEVQDYIKNETNESIEGMKSHYTLAHFENQKTGKSWYILDGYFEMPSGKILFLDFSYRPDTKVFWPIENYRMIVPAASERFLLKAEKICNPYERNFIGVIRIINTQDLSIDRLQFYLKSKHQKEFSILATPSETFIIDNTRDTFWGDNPQPYFTLAEESFIKGMNEDLGLNAEVMQSGRMRSDDEMKMTYVGVTDSCK